MSKMTYETLRTHHKDLRGGEGIKNGVWEGSRSLFIHCDVLVWRTDPAISLRVISDELVMRSESSGYLLPTSSLPLFTPSFGAISVKGWFGLCSIRNYYVCGWLVRGIFLFLLLAMTWQQWLPCLSLLQDDFLPTKSEVSSVFWA